MILLQLSAAKGPDECALAVYKAFVRLQLEAQQMDVEVSLLEQQAGGKPDTFLSVLCALTGKQAESLAQLWRGSFLWTCQSPYRPSHKRKNWYFGGETFEIEIINQKGDIEFQYCRASGAGGQHVNKTDSAVRATHRQSGIAVKVETERSQHANKRLAIALIGKKLQESKQQAQAQNTAKRRLHHYHIERGNAQRCFSGMNFQPK